jgi:hypothetical protein
MERGGWWHSVPVEMDREWGKSSVEGQRRCRVLRSWGAPFIEMGEGR